MEKMFIYTYTIIRVPVEEFAAEAPYITAIIEKEDGSRFMAKVDGYMDGMEVKIGQTVFACEGDDGKTRYHI